MFPRRWVFRNWHDGVNITGQVFALRYVVEIPLAVTLIISDFLVKTSPTVLYIAFSNCKSVGVGHIQTQIQNEPANHFINITKILLLRLGT